jgi:hypothetical protein
MHVKLASLFLLTAALALDGCRSAPAPTADRAPSVNPLPPQITGGLDSEEARQARQLYLNKCARCHQFYDPAHYSDAEWQTWMHKMSRKAKLDPGQEEMLTKYLESFRQQRGQ